VLDSLTNLVGSSDWTYLVLFAFALADSVIPLIPSETAVIIAGVVAAAGDLQIGLVIAAAATGAICGDNIAYTLGAYGRPWVERRFSGEKARQRLAWAHDQLAVRGPSLIFVARFVPGGRTAVTLTCGMSRMPRLRFLLATVGAGVVWATYAALIGYVGGRAFEQDHWKAFGLAFGVAVGVALLTELVRKLRERRHHRTAADGS
jgi:membrane protein DedA with SNARE-associated domain